MKQVTIWIILFHCTLSSRNLVSSKSGYICWRLRYLSKCSEKIGKQDTAEGCCQLGAEGYTKFNTSWHEFSISFIKLTPSACLACNTASCTTLKCKRGKRCKAISSINVRCVCDADCSKDLEGVVCGTDGKTYASICNLDKKSCHDNQTVSLAYFGKCKPKCEGVRCSKGKSCLYDQEGTSHCINRFCPKSCPARGTMVCGGDGVTYSSECESQRAACRKQIIIGVSHLGSCTTGKTCAHIKCIRGQQCVLKSSGKPICVRCTCSYPNFFNRNTFCGSDGKMYPSPCELRAASCKTGKLVTADFTGKKCKTSL